MIILEVTDDKFGKMMKAATEIGKHSECLSAILEDLAEDSELDSRYGSRRNDDDMYNSRYGMRRGRRY